MTVTVSPDHRSQNGFSTDPKSLASGPDANHISTLDPSPNSSSVSQAETLSLTAADAPGTIGDKGTPGETATAVDVDDADNTGEGPAGKKPRGRPSTFQGPWAAMMILILEKEFDAADKPGNGFLYHQLATKGIKEFGYPKKYFGSDSLYLGREDELTALSPGKQKRVQLKRRAAYMKLVSVSHLCFIVSTSTHL